MRCIENGIIPIVCITGPEQVPDLKNIIIAWEPVGAISTGKDVKIPTAADIEKVHNQIAEIAGGAPVLYGGSVNPENAREILAVTDGVLVGGASLDPVKFKEIVNER